MTLNEDSPSFSEVCPESHHSARQGSLLITVIYQRFGFRLERVCKQILSLNGCEIMKKLNFCY